MLPILLVALGFASLTSANSFGPEQIRFSSPSSSTSSDSSLVKLKFPTREALELALSTEYHDSDVWHKSYNSTSRAWELVYLSPTSAPLATSLDSTSSHVTLVPSISELLSQPSQDPTHLSLLSTSSIENLTFSLDSPLSTIHDTYHPFNGVETIFDAFLRHWGKGWIRKEEVGKSWEGREINVYTISDYSSSSPSATGTDNYVEEEEEGEINSYGKNMKKKKKQKGTKPRKDKIGIVVYGALHAREWISTSTIIYLSHHLLLQLDAKEGNFVRELLRRVEFSFIPILNPDGYAYTWESPAHRLWRKSRQPSPLPPSKDLFDEEKECLGIDLNKNWNHTFSPSRDECSDSFSGSKPFESVELDHLSKWLIKKSLKDPNQRLGLLEEEEKEEEDKKGEEVSGARVRAVLDLHSFGEQLLYPYSSDCSNPPPTSENLYECLLAGSKALKSKHGRSWQVGESCQTGIKGGGEGLDWIYDVAKIPWSFTAQLRDSGIYGFLLPPAQIRPSGEEFSEALKAISKFIVDKEK